MRTQTTTPHWNGFGAVALPNPQNRAVINAANDLLASLDSGAVQGSLPVVSAFQNAYNASGLPGQLTVDGEYGPSSQRALQNAMDQAQADAGAGPSQAAPQNAYSNTESTIPALDPTVAPATPGAPGAPGAPGSATVVVDTAPPNYVPYAIAGVAAAAVVAGVVIARRRKKR
jgi:hypothetical protein